LQRCFAIAPRAKPLSVGVYKYVAANQVLAEYRRGRSGEAQPGNCNQKHSDVLISLFSHSDLQKEI